MYAQESRQARGRPPDFVDPDSGAALWLNQGQGNEPTSLGLRLPEEEARFALPQGPLVEPEYPGPARRADFVGDGYQAWQNLTKDGVPYLRVLVEGLDAFRAFPPQTQTRAPRPRSFAGFGARRSIGWGNRLAQAHGAY